MLTITHADFLRAILVNPADDLVRLVYADWLEENGEPERAEFIRCQIEIALLTCQHAPEFLPCPQRHGPSANWCANCQAERNLRRRERELLESPAMRSAADAFAALLGLTSKFGTDHGILGGMNGNRWEWQRGFVAEINTTLATWQEHCPAIVAAQPVEWVELIDRKPYESSFNNGRFCWFHPDVPSGNSPPEERYLWAVLPLPIFSLLNGGSGSVSLCKWYDSQRDAIADASCAAISWARQQAGLPPLAQ